MCVHKCTKSLAKLPIYVAIITSIYKYKISTKPHTCVYNLLLHMVDIIMYIVTADSNNKLLPFALVQRCGGRIIFSTVLVKLNNNLELGVSGPEDR